MIRLSASAQQNLSSTEIDIIETSIEALDEISSPKFNITLSQRQAEWILKNQSKIDDVIANAELVKMSNGATLKRTKQGRMYGDSIKYFDKLARQYKRTSRSNVPKFIEQLTALFNIYQTENVWRVVYYDEASLHV